MLRETISHILGERVDSQLAKDLKATIASFPDVSGAYDLLVLVEARTLKELAAFVSGKLSPLETVTGTATSFVLKRYKEDGVVFEGEESDRRLVVSP